MLTCCCFFFFKQKTAYEMRISDWSSDVCSSDLRRQDLVRMTWKDFQGSIIRVRQNKTGEPLMIPCHKDLRAHLEGLSARFGPIIRAADGKTLNANALSSAMNRAVAAIDNMPHQIGRAHV